MLQNFNTLKIGFPSSAAMEHISKKEWNVFPNLPSGPEDDPYIPGPEPEPEPAGHADTWYKYAGDTEWKIASISGSIAGTPPTEGPSTPTTQIPNISNVVALEIGTDVTSIGDYAFQNCNGLTSITIPDSVTSIGSSAFEYCSGLTGVTIPNRVTSIGDEAFFDCRGLTSVTIPDSVTSIGNSAFYNCSGLTSVTIPNSVTSIGDDAFHGCSGLISVIFQGKTLEQVRQMDNFSWSIPATCIIECSDGKLIYVDGVWTNFEDHNVYYTTASNDGWHVGTAKFRLGADEKIIFDGFVEKSTATRVIIPSKDDSGNSVTSIGDGAFSGCNGLKGVTIPDSVTSIRGAAFSWCSRLTSATIPNSVRSIGRDAFYNCSRLTSVTIGDSVTSIGYQAFYNCSGLTSVTIPDSVTNIGERAFKDCSGLTSVTIIANGGDAAAVKTKLIAAGISADIEWIIL